jgi:hypothetical protein
MATNIARLSEKSQVSLVKYARAILTQHQKNRDMYNKMFKIDVAYSRYKATQGTDGEDVSAASLPIDTTSDNSIIAPVVVAQVDTIVGYLCDVFLSGYPMFPVVTSPSSIKEGTILQAIMDTHATLGGYVRQLKRMFHDGVKYNLSAIETDWAPIDRYSVVVDTQKPLNAQTAVKATEHYNRLYAPNIYNLIYDRRVEDLADVSIHGEFVGYIRLLSRIGLMRHIQNIGKEYTYNQVQSFSSISGSTADPANGLYFTPQPQISDIVAQINRSGTLEFDWDSFAASLPMNKGRMVHQAYEVARVYARIVPGEHGIASPNSDKPQIWRIELVNSSKLLEARPIISAYDILPILIGQPLEDGFAEQTKSLAENQIPFQDAITTLTSIRFNSARRAVSDRAIYDPLAISQKDVNNRSPAPKIPIRANSLMGGKTIDSIYKSIPYDGRGAEGTMQDADMLYRMSGQMSGINKPQTGEFQKGNKSVREWTDTMAGSDNRLRLPALSYEVTVFSCLKENLKLNIYQYGPKGVFFNYGNKESLNVTEQELAALRSKVLYFKVADGLTPASKIAGTDVLREGMNMISQSPILQQQLGVALPGIFMHFMQLSGVMGLEEYIPRVPAQQGSALQNEQQKQIPVNAGNPA